MKNIKFQNTENGLSISITQTIKNYEPTGFEISPVEERNNHRGYTCDVIGAFSQRLIASLERRMQACQNNLLNHLEDCVSHHGEVITWVRKDGTQGSFSIKSFEVMEKAIAILKGGAWQKFINNGYMLEQSIKALMNDTEQDHSDTNGFRYSELVSVLIERYHEVVSDRALGKVGL